MHEQSNHKCKLKELQDFAVRVSPAVEVVCRCMGRICGLQSVGGTAENSVNNFGRRQMNKDNNLQCRTELANQCFIKQYLL